MITKDKNTINIPFKDIQQLQKHTVDAGSKVGYEIQCSTSSMATLSHLYRPGYSARTGYTTGRSFYCKAEL
ncbi:hypothetical protein KQX54_015437 [Cotesia glomerata]|uniref:Uncharacterized protein n=1 Tax=Cotesia glomerata TaxID=32391 RepID=A0AAV7IE43_COTGL|nr:hypothetical protein KQX54_015437 [Cotesia glomerata]